MNMRLKLTVCALLGGAGSLCSQLASALDAPQRPPIATPAQLGDDHRHGSRSAPKPLIDVPMSVTALSGRATSTIYRGRDFLLTMRPWCRVCP